MKYYLLFFGVFCLLFSCKDEQSKSAVFKETTEQLSFEEIERINWLKGEWVNSTETEYSKETWSQENDSTLKGFSYTQVGQDTVFAEILTLQQLGEKMALTVVAFNQNDDAPVTFMMKPSKEGVFMFENLSHDFPQRIVYTNPTQDSIHAWVEGTVEGELKRVDFSFSKIY